MTSIFVFFKLFFFLGFGIFLRSKFKKDFDPFLRILIYFLIYICSPILIFRSSVYYGPESFKYVLFIIFFLLFVFFISKIFFILLNLEGNSFFRYIPFLVCTCNAGYFGVPIASNLFSSSDMNIYFLISFGYQLFFFLFILPFFRSFQKQHLEKISNLEWICSIFKLPHFILFFIGIFINVTFPSLYFDFCNSFLNSIGEDLSRLYSVCGFIVLGSYLFDAINFESNSIFKIRLYKLDFIMFFFFKYFFVSILSIFYYLFIYYFLNFELPYKIYIFFIFLPIAINNILIIDTELKDLQIFTSLCSIFSLIISSFVLFCYF